MPSLLVIVFAVEVAAHLIGLVGAAALNNLLWTAINYLPVSTSKAAAEQRSLQTEYLKVRRELNATSSQDEFAKWAKLRRQHDKQLEKLEQSKKSQEAARASFDRYLNMARLLLTKAPQYIIPFWYAKEPMFWLPYGWFPYYAEWIISFPRAPMGSVSIASWQLACKGIITVFSDLIRGLLGLFLAAGEPKVKQPEAPVKAASGEKAAGAEKAKSTKASGKSQVEDKKSS